MLFPEARWVVEAMAGTQTPVWTEGYDIEADLVRARAFSAAEAHEEVEEVREVDADGVRCRLYRPVGARAGLVVHLHGGGFVFNDIDVHDPAARRLANRTGLSVLSVDYRRPPEHRFPAAPDDVDTVLGWLTGAGSGLTTGPTYVHGDSAGANLAVVAALRNPGRFTAAVLIYPFLDPSASFPAYRQGGVGFDPREAAWYWEQYAGSEADLTDPDLAPLLSDRLASLPPLLVVTAEGDILRDEGEHLAHLAAAAGVQVEATRYLGQIHGFWRHASVFPAAEQVLRQTAGFLREHSGISASVAAD